MAGDALPLRSRAGDTLDMLLWRVLGRAAGVIEPVLAANPGLADRGLVLPANTTVIVPAAAGGRAAERPLTQLWE